MPSTLAVAVAPASATVVTATPAPPPPPVVPIWEVTLAAGVDAPTTLTSSVVASSSTVAIPLLSPGVAITSAVEKNDDKEHSSFEENVRTISLEKPKPREFHNEVSA